MWIGDLQEELGVAANNGLDQGISVCGLLRDRFAKCERVAASLVGRQIEVVSSNCRCKLHISLNTLIDAEVRRRHTANIRTAGFHGFHSRCGSTVFKLQRS